jgi:hypothetical protein
MSGSIYIKPKDPCKRNINPVLELLKFPRNHGSQDIRTPLAGGSFPGELCLLSILYLETHVLGGANCVKISTTKLATNPRFSADAIWFIRLASQATSTAVIVRKCKTELSAYSEPDSLRVIYHQTSGFPTRRGKNCRSALLVLCQAQQRSRVCVATVVALVSAVICGSICFNIPIDV